MEKINLCVERSFSDLITATINFMKQEFVPFIRAFAVIGFPGILLVLFFMKDLLMDSLNMSMDQEEIGLSGLEDTLVHTVFIWCFNILLMMWVQLFSISYLRVYWDHYRAGVEERITIGEVFRMMMKKIGIYIVWSLFYGIIVVVGMFFLLIPGIYFGLALTFGIYLILIKDSGLGKILTESMAMTKGIWWRTMGYVVVLQLLVGIVAYLFNIPYMSLTLTQLLTGEIPGVYEITFTLLISYLGQYTLYTVVFIGIGMLFFSRIEELEHTTLLSKIDQLGGAEKKANEGVD